MTGGRSRAPCEGDGDTGETPRGGGEEECLGAGGRVTGALRENQQRRGPERERPTGCGEAERSPIGGAELGESFRALESQHEHDGGGTGEPDEHRVGERIHRDGRQNERTGGTTRSGERG